MPGEKQKGFVMGTSQLIQRLTRSNFGVLPEQRIEQIEAENLRLRHGMKELSILNEVASAVASTWSLDSIVELIVQKCVKHLKVEQGALWLFERRQEGPVLRTVFRKVQTTQRSAPYRLGDQIIGWIIRNQQSLVINNLTSDGRFPLGETEAAVRSLLCVPLRLNGQLIGALGLFNKRGSEGFSNNDERLLVIIAAQSAQVIENARLYEEEHALRAMQQDVRMARDIQMRLLPKNPPSIAGYDVAGKSTPAHNVGGDYFDFLSMGEGCVGLCLGDVSGKGISAALLMANVQATMRGQCMRQPSACQSLRYANRQLYQSTDSDKFVTMFYGVLDPASGQLRYSNAGHNPPILIPDRGEPEFLTAGGPVLGVFPSVSYEEATVRLHRGDLLLIYSDGFSEAMNADKEEFGEQRLLETAAKYRDTPAAELIDRMEEAVKNHCADALPADDMTMMAVRSIG